MLYVLEGVDGVGKSTCFEFLKSHLPHSTFIKESYTDDEEVKTCRYVRFAKLACNERQTVIYDRATAVDDHVYKPIIDGTMSLLPIYRRSSVTPHPKIIYLYGTEANIAKRLSDRGDDLVNVDMLNNISKKYEEVLNKTSADVIRVCVDGLTQAQVANKVYDIVTNKPFKLAHIVPVSQLHTLRDEGYVMCLAHLVRENKLYKRFYANLASNHRTYVLMDNGAAEGSQLTNEQLLECYCDIKPNEMVLPDTICDSESTLAKFEEAIGFFIHEHNLHCKFMAVPQGSTFNEWCECAEKMVSNKYVNSIGVSKFLTTATGNQDVRFMAVEWIDKLRKKYGRFDIEVHLLGCNEPPRRISEIRRRFAFVRGCDSAFGYLCSQAGQEIFDCTERPEGEIDFINGKVYNSLTSNLTAFELAAGVFDNGCDQRGWMEG